MYFLLWIDEKPLREKLQLELSCVSSQLAELREKLDAYFSRDLPQYQAWLNHNFSKQFSEIYNLEKKVCALGHHLQETIELSLKMGKEPGELFANWSEEQVVGKLLEQQDAEQGDMCDQMLEPGEKKSVQRETRELYKRIVRKLHPDTRGDLSEAEKNLWVQAQRAYAQNDAFELFKIEQALSRGQLQEVPLSYSDLRDQLEEFKKRLMQLNSEVVCLQTERAWGFCQKKNLKKLESEVVLECQATLRDLKAKEQHLSKTFNSWSEPKSKATAKPKRKVLRAQESLF